MNQNEALLAKALSFTFIIGIITYGFAAFGLMPYHDSLWCVYHASSTHNELDSQIGYGRVLVPSYITITGTIATTPTTSVVIALIWVSMSVFLICKMLDTTRTIEVVLVSAICSANRTMIALIVTYLPWLGADSFSLLLATAAAYLWKMHRRKRFLWQIAIASVCIGISLGLYQSYVCTFIVLVLLVSIKSLLEGKSIVSVLRDGLGAIFILSIGCCLYLILLIVIPSATDIELAQGGYNNVTNIGSNNEPWTRRLGQTLEEVIGAFFSDKEIPSIWNPSFIVATNIGIALSALVLLILVAKKQKNRASAVVGSIALMLAAIFFANYTRCLNPATHDLMYYAFWLLYLLPLLFLNKEHKLLHSNRTQRQPFVSRAASFVIVIGLAFITFNNIQLSNTALLDRSIRYSASQSLITEMLTRIDELPNYVEGKTKVAFVGEVNGHLLSPTTSKATEMLLWQKDGGESFTGYRYLQIQINDLMLRPTSILSESEASELSELPEIASMPTWPSAKSVQMIDGIAVVKLS